jgi:hypothetical protein
MSTRCAAAKGSSSRKNGARGSPDGDESNEEVVVARFTTIREKLNCAWLAVTPVVHSDEAAVERARRQWRQRKTKCAREREGANTMTRWGGDREAIHP